MSKKNFIVRPEFKVNLSEEDIRDIIITALDDGIGYWARLEDFGASGDVPISEQAAEVLLAGGSLMFIGAAADHENQDVGSWTLTLDKFLNGVKLCLEEGCYLTVENNRLGTFCIYAKDADRIIQFALFGKVIYG